MSDVEENVMKKILIVLVLLFSVMEVQAEDTRIAVLPFRNLMQKEDLNWLSEGIASTITAKLGSIKGLALVERTQLQLTIKELGLQQSGIVDDSTAVKAGKSMGAQIVVIGEFQVVGDQVRISARFVEVQTAKVVSTTVVTGSFQNIFTLQDDVSFSLAKNLNIDIGEDIKKEIKGSAPSNITAYEYYSKGYAQWTQGDLDKALEYYQKAVSIDPNYENALFELGYINNEKGEYRKAIEYYNKVAVLNPRAKDALNNLGLAYSQLNDIPNAEKWYKKSLELDPNNPLSLNGLGLVMWKDKRYKDAEYWYKKAIQSDPKYFLAYYNLGIVYEADKQYDESIKHYIKTLELKPDYANAMINLGLLYETKKKDYSEADYWYQKAVKAEPNSYLVYYNLGFLYS
ncbi:MAG: tetratricopeptide repeat protein, partial [Nitrospirae bacterium]